MAMANVSERKCLPSAINFCAQRAPGTGIPNKHTSIWAPERHSEARKSHFPTITSISGSRLCFLSVIIFMLLSTRAIIVPLVQCPTPVSCLSATSPMLFCVLLYPVAFSPFGKRLTWHRKACRNRIARKCHLDIWIHVHTYRSTGAGQTIGQLIIFKALARCILHILPWIHWIHCFR